MGQGILTAWLPYGGVNSQLKKSPWSDREGAQGGILIWFKDKYTNYIELVRDCKNDVWFKLKNQINK